MYRKERIQFSEAPSSWVLKKNKNRGKRKRRKDGKGRNLRERSRKMRKDGIIKKKETGEQKY